MAALEPIYLIYTSDIMFLLLEEKIELKTINIVISN